MRSRVTHALDVVAGDVAQRVRENISASGPPHSAPGEYPRRITGELQASVGHSVDPVRLEAAIYADAEHAPHVEKIRPFLLRTMAEMRSYIQRRMISLMRF